MTCCFLECSLVFPERDNLDKDHPDDEDSLLGYEKDEEFRKYKCTVSFHRFYRTLQKYKRKVCTKCMSKECRNCVCYFFLFFLSALLVTGTVLFVALPLAFKYSVALERSFIFSPVTGPSHLYNDFDYKSYDDNKELKFHNFHVDVNEKDNVKLGVWNITYLNTNYARRNYIHLPNLLLFHSEIGDRRSYKPAYNGLVDMFNVTVFDYRSYGDSSIATLTETGLIDDSVQLYKWLQNRSNGDIYVMADKLGAAIATRVLSKLREEKIIPTGVMLVHPFTTLSDSIQEWYWPLGWIFSWMPWYDSTITNALEENDLVFNTTKYITDVDCPILIITNYGHSLAEKLALVAGNRDAFTQGSITMEKTWWKMKDYCCNNFISDFIYQCNDFKQNKGKI